MTAPYALSAALIDYHRLGIEIPDSVLSAVRGAFGPEADPCATFLGKALMFFSEAEWMREFAQNSGLVDDYLTMLERIWQQKYVLGQSSHSSFEDAFLVARRFMQFAVAGIPTMEEIQNKVRADRKLPLAEGGPRSLFVGRAISTRAKFLRQLNLFLSCRPIDGKDFPTSAEADEPTFEDFDDGKWAAYATTQWSAHDVLRPMLPCLLQSAEALADDADAVIEDLRYAALNGLVIYYGFEFRDALMLWVGPDTGELSGPGRLDLTEGLLLRRMGDGYFPGGSMFERAELPLPIPPQLLKLICRCVVDTNVPRRLEDLWDPGFHEYYADRLRAEIAAWQPRMNFRTVGLQHSFDAAALFSCGLFPCELSLLRGRSVYGSNTECSYVSASGVELLSGWLRIHRQIRLWASLPAEEFPVQQPADCLFGRKVPSLRAYIEDIRARIQHATTWNELVACMEALNRAIGARNRVHVNPASRLRHFPRPCLQFNDKERLSEPVGLRNLPLVEPLAGFVALARRLFGDCPYLIYIDPAKGACCRSEDLSDHALFQWLSMPKAQSIGRTAYFNELRIRRVGGAPRSCLTGHHNKDVAQSLLFPVCGAKLYDDVAGILGPMLCDVCFPEAVRELSAAFEKFPIPAGAGDFSKAQNKGADIVNVDGDIPHLAPLSAAEDVLAIRLGRQLLGNGVRLTLPLEGWATGILLALEIGIPFWFLARNRDYLTFRCFIQEEASGKWFFAPPLEQEDVGHLSPYVFQIPDAGLTMQHILACFRKLQSGRSGRPIDQFLNSQILGPRTTLHSRTRKYVNQLLSRRGDTVRLSAKVAIRLLDRVSCQLCAYYQPSSVAARLRGSLPFGINHIKVADVVERIVGHKPNIVDIAGRSWQGETFVPAAHRRATKKKSPVSFLRWTKRLKKCRKQMAPAVRRDPVGEVTRLFVSNRIAPARSRFQTVLEIMGITGPTAARLTNALYYRFRAQGNLSPTKPVEICMPKELSRLSDRIRTMPVHLQPHKATWDEEQWLNKHSKEQLALSLFAGDRIGETVALLSHEVSSGDFGNFIYVYDGKTQSARRAVNLDRISGVNPGRLTLSLPLERLENMPEGRFENEAVKTTEMRLRRLLEEVSDLTLHGLRRSQIFSSLLFALETEYRHGNLVEHLATLTRCYGHCSLITFLHSYVGGMLATLAYPPIGWHSLDRRETGEVCLCDLAPVLTRLYDGSEHAIRLLSAALNRIRARPTCGGPPASRCWIGDERQIVKQTRWSDQRSTSPVWPESLPDKPKLPEFWETIARMKVLAARRNLSVLLAVSAKTQTDFRARFEEILGPNCWAGRSP